jgi:hypothetical protein
MTNLKVRSTHQEKRLERFFGIHIGHITAGNLRSFVANRVTEFKILTFVPMGKIVKLKDSQLEIREVKKKIK